MEIRAKKIYEDAKLPEFQKEDDSGADLRAYDENWERLVLRPGEIKLVKTGIAVEIPKGYEGQVRPRSGLALKNGITVLNSPGTVDASYRGNLGIILANFGHDVFTVKKGDKIAQFVISKVENVSYALVDSLSETERGEGGFGSTGV